MTPGMRQNLSTLRLKPGEFVDYLTGVVGFESPISVGKTCGALDASLKREILIFRRSNKPLRIVSTDIIHPTLPAQSPEAMGLKTLDRKRLRQERSSSAS